MEVTRKNSEKRRDYKRGKERVRERKRERDEEFVIVIVFILSKYNAFELVISCQKSAN